MRYLLVGAASAVAAAAVAAVVFLGFVDTGSNAPYEPKMVWISKEAIPKGTRIKSDDLYFLNTLARNDVEDRAMPVPPWVGAVAAVDIPRGDQHTVGDYLP